MWREHLLGSGFQIMFAFWYNYGARVRSPTLYTVSVCSVFFQKKRKKLVSLRATDTKGRLSDPDRRITQLESNLRRKIALFVQVTRGASHRARRPYIIQIGCYFSYENSPISYWPTIVRHLTAHRSNNAIRFEWIAEHIDHMFWTFAHKTT